MDLSEYSWIVALLAVGATAGATLSKRRAVGGVVGAVGGAVVAAGLTMYGDRRYKACIAAAPARCQANWDSGCPSCRMTYNPFQAL